MRRCDYTRIHVIRGHGAVVHNTMSLLLASHNSVFAAAFVILLCFALLEGISLVMGLGISDFLSDLLGLPDGPDALETDATETGMAGPLLAWLEIGKVPLLVSLCSFLAAFSVGGMLLQQSLQLAGFSPLAQPLAAAIAFGLALPGLKLANRILGRFWPRDESSSFAADLLIGRVGVVTIGTASATRAAEVKVTGPDGRSHYVMCFVSGDSVPQGGEVLLQSRDEATGHYHGAKNTNPDLSPTLYL
jgi:Protein of unknown function (DUF1449)